MKKFLLLPLLFLVTLLSAAEPLFKVGIVTDTHVTPDKKSCRLVKASAELFRNDGVDMIINCGDIADHYYELGYKHYRDTINEVFAKSEKKPQEIFVYANHDRLDRAKEDIFAVFKDVKKHLQIPNDPYDVINMKGYTFVVVPQYLDFDRYEAMVAKACKENPGKPVFVVDHVPPFDTVTPNRGDLRRRKLFNKYPQVVHINGHHHGTLSNELQFWQGEFTSVNAGCLQLWTGSLVGSSAPSYRTDMVMIMDVYPDKLVFRRFFSTTRKEYRPKERWSVPLPFDPATAPYTAKRRYESSVAPEFPKNAKTSIRMDNRDVRIRFSRANHRDGIYYYRVDLQREEADGSWQNFARRDVRGQFMLPPEKRKKTLVCRLNNSYFEVGKNYRAVFTPVHFFGKEGKSMTTAPFSIKSKDKFIVNYENKTPMDLVYRSNRKRPFRKDKDGFHIVTDDYSWLILPDDIWDEMPKGTAFRFIIDLHAKQSDNNPVSLTLRNRTSRKNARLPVKTAGGDPGVTRYIIEGYKKAADHRYDLLIRGAIPSKMKFHYIRCEYPASGR